MSQTGTGGSSNVNGVEYAVGPTYAINGEISTNNLFRIPTFASAYRFITETVAPLRKKVLDKDKNELRDHEAYYLLNVKPNDYAGPTVTHQTHLGHAIATGNGYAYVNRDKGKLRSIVNAQPKELVPFAVDNVKYFWHTERNEVLVGRDVLHLMGISNNAIIGVDPAYLFLDTFDTARVLAKYQLQYFKHGSFINGAIQVPPELTKDDVAFKAMVAQWSKRHSVDNAGRAAFLLGGAQWVNTTMDNDQTKLVENRQLSNEDIARIMRVDPVLVYAIANGDNDRVFRSLAKGGLRTWLEQQEDEYTLKMLTDAELRAGTHIRVDATDLLRGDPQRIANLIAMVNAGLTIPDICCDEMDLPPLPNGAGRVVRMPVNVAQPVKGNDAVADPVAAPINPDTAAAVPEATVPTPVPEAAAAPAAPAADSLPNGAQATSLKDIIVAVAKGELPRDSGVALVAYLTGKGQAEADALIGSAGKGTTTTPNANPAVEAPAPETAPAPAPAEQPADYAKLLPLVQAAADKVLTKHRKSFEAHKSKPGFTEWVLGFGNKQGEYLAKELAPLATMTGTSFIKVVRAYEESVISEQPYQLAEEIYNAIQGK